MTTPAKLTLRYEVFTDDVRPRATAHLEWRGGLGGMCIASAEGDSPSAAIEKAENEAYRLLEAFMRSVR